MSAFDELRGLLRLRGLQLGILGLLLAMVGWRSFKLKFCVLDLDIWWHLKVGEWIVEHRGFPHVGILSRTAADRPWAAYSWGYEVLLSRAYDCFGLVGAGVFGTVLTIGVAYAVYWMVRRLSGRFWVGCLLGIVTCSAFLFNLMPRPVYWATDVNPEYLEYLETLREARPYMRVRYLDAMNMESFPARESFDTVVCLNVIEHVKDDLRALRNVFDVLEPGGRAIILVPNGPDLYGSLDKVLGHFRRYTIDELKKVSQEAGFTVEEILKFNRPGVPAWWLNGKILKRETFGLGQIRLLNLLTPIFRLVDPILPLPPLSIIAILRKSSVPGEIQNR